MRIKLLKDLDAGLKKGDEREVKSAFGQRLIDSGAAEEIESQVKTKEKAKASPMSKRKAPAKTKVEAPEKTKEEPCEGCDDEEPCEDCAKAAIEKAKQLEEKNKSKK